MEQANSDNGDPQTTKDQHIPLLPGFQLFLGSNCFLCTLASVRTGCVGGGEHSKEYQETQAAGVSSWSEH